MIRIWFFLKTYWGGKRKYSTHLQVRKKQQRLLVKHLKRILRLSPFYSKRARPKALGGTSSFGKEKFYSPFSRNQYIEPHP